MSGNRKPTFVTADWHLGHANCIDFDQRPFNSLEQMHQYLIRHYNSQVPDHGICYFLGDIGVGNSELTKSIITQLKGTKVLILGNHDKKSDASYAMGFDVVMYGGVLYVQGERVTMSHCPLVGVFRENMDHFPEHKKKIPAEMWHGEGKYGHMYGFTDEGQFHLHGHIHSKDDTPHKRPKTKYQFDVGLPANNYKLVNISTIESWISQNKVRGIST